MEDSEIPPKVQSCFGWRLWLGLVSVWFGLNRQREENYSDRLRLWFSFAWIWFGFFEDLAWICFSLVCSVGEQAAKRTTLTKDGYTRARLCVGKAGNRLRTSSLKLPPSLPVVVVVRGGPM